MYPVAKQQKHLSDQETLLFLSTRLNIYSSAMAGGVATPPMLIVFHDKYTTLDPLWHVRHLGKILSPSHTQKIVSVSS